MTVNESNWSEWLPIFRDQRVPFQSKTSLSMERGYFFKTVFYYFKSQLLRSGNCLGNRLLISGTQLFGFN